MKIYGIGGLGVDKRVFSELSLDFEFVILEWILPKKKEPFTDFVVRFSRQIDTSQPFSIVGVSFGGMIAIELNKIIRPEKIVLISSASGRKDIPRLFRMLGKVGILRLIPDFLMTPPHFMSNWLFGVYDAKYRTMLHQIINDTDIHFLRWALEVILKWDNKNEPVNMTRIHGSKDRLLSFPRKKNVIVIQNAGHFMVANHANEVSRIMNEIFSFKIA